MIRSLFCAVLLSLGAAPLAGHAETPAEHALRVLDEAMRIAKDQAFDYDIVTWEPGKGERTMQFSVRVRPPTWRRIDFSAPADIKGMKVLILSLSEMYIYLPAYRKVRRIAGHVRQQSFQGTALSNDDMSITQYGEAFVATKLLKEDAKSWRIELTRKPKSDFPYLRLEMTILKKEHMPLDILYFNDKGVKVKSEEREGYSCRSRPKGSVCNCKVMKLTDHTRNGLWSKLIMKSWQIDTGVPDSFFSQRDIQRGG
jgi:outer membrane lipoprotein-sorting protein